MSAHVKSHPRHHDGSMAALTEEITGLKDTVTTGVTDVADGGRHA